MQHSTDTDQVRAQGPAQVRAGPLEMDTVVVLDPSGEASHGGLPATWRPLTEDVGVVWCRLPAVRRQDLAGGQLLPQLAGGQQRIHVVGIGSSALLAVALAMTHRDLVRSLIVVDPPWPAEDLAEVRRFGDESTLMIQQIETADQSTTLPIGHPDVVRAIVQVLITAGAGRTETDDDTDDDTAQTPNTVRDKLADALEAFATELGELSRRRDVQQTRGPGQRDGQ